jgi:hypothetical protein
MLFDRPLIKFKYKFILRLKKLLTAIAPNNIQFITLIKYREINERFYFIDLQHYIFKTRKIKIRFYI